jgi:hypothetical protein
LAAAPFACGRAVAAADVAAAWPAVCRNVGNAKLGTDNSSMGCACPRLEINAETNGRM